MNIDFGANKTPVEVIKEGALEEPILETFFLVSRKKFDEPKNTDQNYNCSN